MASHSDYREEFQSVCVEDLTDWERIYNVATSGFFFKVKKLNIRINTVMPDEEEGEEEEEGAVKERGWFAAVEFEMPELKSSGHISLCYLFKHSFNLDIFEPLLRSGDLEASFLPGRPGSMFTKLGDCNLRDLIYDILDEMYLPWLFYGGPDLVKEYEDTCDSLHFHWY